MRVSATPLPGAFIVESDLQSDARGSFFRTFCQKDFESQGLPGSFVQASISRNTLRGTLRGLHFQSEPRPEGKLVRCIRGTIYDVIVDLRSESTTFLKWFSVELDASKPKAIYVPPGFAHGFQTLNDDSDVLYQMTEFYDPALSAGVRWDDRAFAIHWPIEVTRISDRDRTYPDFDH
jgi:dTDP-4-dehydrorhamnose 3,5-epimerase